MGIRELGLGYRSGFVAAVLVTGCAFDPLDSAPAYDPDVDCDSFTDQLDTCLLPPGSPLTLAGTLTFDTATGELHNGTARLDITSLPLQTRGGEVHAIIASTVTIAPGTMLRATGPRGFAILASDAITIGDAALLDVSVGGAGARTLCSDGPALGATLADGAGGGGGAAFGGPGGRGGDGNDDGSAGLGGDGGIALTTAPLGPLGGCPGAAGGYGDDPGGLGGAGGGVLFLASATSISIADAGLHAGGDGGAGGTRTSGNYGDAGGGGGGSGGMIFLEAPLVTSAGMLAANGGGGGEGSGNSDEGAAGDRGKLSTDRASGGSGRSGSGTSGGLGGAIADLRGDPVTTRQNGGAGGGGGGAGFIIVVAPEQDLGANVSPAPF